MVTFPPSRPSKGFLTQSAPREGRSKLVASKYGWLGYNFHNTGRIPLFDNSIFQGGSTQTVSAMARYFPNSSSTIHSHGYSLKTVVSGRSSGPTNRAPSHPISSIMKMDDASPA